MRDIKTHQVQRGTIKTLQKGVKTFDHTIRSGVDAIKGMGGPAAGPAGPADPSADLSRYAQGLESRGTRFVGRKAWNGISKALHTSPARSIQRVKTRAEFAKNSIKTAKQSIKTAGQTAKAGAKQVQAAIKAGQTSVKAASASIKTAGTAANTARATAAAAQKTAVAAAHAIRATVQAAVVAVKAAAHAINAVVQYVSSAIASGGTSVIASLVAAAVVVVLLLIIILCCSAAGVFSGDETADGDSLQSVRIELNEEFAERLNAQKQSLHGYDQITVRPAEAITEWNNIIAVYAVRSQLAGRAAGEMTEENISLLEETLWDMVSFSTSTESVTVPEAQTTDDGSSGSEETETVGVVTVEYLTLTEAFERYGFSDDDRELALLVLEMSSGGGMFAGGGVMINPCPDGTFNGNDYPAYPSGGYHAGRDIACPIGTPVYAAASGTVIHINDQAATYGNHIMIAHGDEVYTLYAHCSELLVSVGDTVSQGQLIALSGNTGNSTGPHLHFEVRVGGSQYRVNNVDPLEWINAQ